MGCTSSVVFACFDFRFKFVNTKFCCLFLTCLVLVLDFCFIGLVDFVVAGFLCFLV